MKFKVGDIVTNAVGFKPGCYIITAINLQNPKNIYSGINVLNKKSYRLSDESIGERIGITTSDVSRQEQVEKFKNSIDNVRFLNGQKRAKMEAILNYQPSDHDKWVYLSNLKQNDLIMVRHGGRTLQASFQYVCEQGVKYVFAVMIGEKLWRFPLYSIMVDNQISNVGQNEALMRI